MTNNEAKALRLKLGMNQTEFYGRAGIEQSTASRYEKGRRIPAPVAMLLKLAYAPKPVADAVYKGLRKV